MFPCEGCGADLHFHIGQQQLKCPYCGFQKAIELAADARVDEQCFIAALERLAARRGKEHADDPPLNEIRCGSCGANVVFHGTLTSRECPFCASPIQRDSVHRCTQRIPVDGVLPFLIDHAVARANLRAWVASRWFAPNAFRQRGINGTFSGVYVPYWTFDSLTANAYVGQRGQHYYVTVGSGKNQRRERRTRWYPASGTFQRFFDDVLVVADSALPRKLLLALEPWPLRRCLPFTAQVLAGHLAKTYDIELEPGFQDARKRMDDAIREEVQHRIGGDEQRITSIATDHSAITYKHLLLPIWLLAYQFHGRGYRVAINAGTGEVQGERPYSWVKITLAVVTGVAALGLLALFILSR